MNGQDDLGAERDVLAPTPILGPEPEEQSESTTEIIVRPVRRAYAGTINVNAAPRWTRDRERGGWVKGDRFVPDEHVFEFERRMRADGPDQLRGMKMPARLDLLTGEQEDR